jgi:hypothetical protein
MPRSPVTQVIAKIASHPGLPAQTTGACERPHLGCGPDRHSPPSAPRRVLRASARRRLRSAGRGHQGVAAAGAVRCGLLRLRRWLRRSGQRPRSAHHHPRVRLRPGRDREPAVRLSRDRGFAGLAASTVWGTWWLDGMVVLGIAGWAVAEGRRAWAGKSCGCAPSPGCNLRSLTTNIASGFCTNRPDRVDLEGTFTRCFPRGERLRSGP